MYNLIMPCSLSYIIVPKYCHIDDSLLYSHKDNKKKEHLFQIMAANSQQCKTRFKKIIWLSMQLKNNMVIYAASLMRRVTIYFNL